MRCRLRDTRSRAPECASPEISEASEARVGEDEGRVNTMPRFTAARADNETGGTYGKEDFIADFDRTGHGQELVLGLDKVRGRLQRGHDAETARQRVRQSR